MSWVVMDGAGWSWVDGLVIPYINHVFADIEVYLLSLFNLVFQFRRFSWILKWNREQKEIDRSNQNI